MSKPEVDGAALKRRFASLMPVIYFLYVNHTIAGEAVQLFCMCSVFYRVSTFDWKALEAKIRGFPQSIAAGHVGKGMAQGPALNIKSDVQSDPRGLNLQGRRG